VVFCILKINAHGHCGRGSLLERSTWGYDLVVPPYVVPQAYGNLREEAVCGKKFGSLGKMR